MVYVGVMRDMINLIVESEGIALELFHGTSADHLPGIRAKGLVPQPPPDYCWPEFDEMIEDSDEDEPQLPPEAFEPRVFATDSLSAAREYASNHGTPVVLRIRTNYMDWDEGETDHPYQYTTKTVPPELLDVLVDGQWVSILA